MTAMRRKQRRHRPTLAAALVTMGLAVSGAGSAQQRSDGDIAVIENLMWAVATNGENLPWSDADQYCETLELGGHDDWRLPTLPEVEALHDPAADARGGIRSPFELDECCVWSSTNLVELEADAKGVLPEPTNAPADYYWGVLFPSGVRYYSFGRFPDGQALCVRNAR
jgi:hypothetical protein